MPEHIAPKPTVYRGIQFRSRLEARWAAFFDACEWRWDYEPAMPTRGWIPDFALHGDQGTITLVEVRPYQRLSEFADQGHKIARAIQALPAPWPEVLLLGVSPTVAQGHQDPDDMPRFGWLFEASPEAHQEQIMAEDGQWADWAVFAVYQGTDWRPDFCAEYGDFHGRLTGGYDGNPGDNPTRAAARLRAAWAQACNATQWRPPQSGGSR